MRQRKCWFHDEVAARDWTYSPPFPGTVGTDTELATRAVPPVPTSTGNERNPWLRTACSQINWEQGEQILKLQAYVFPLFPGTGRNTDNL